MTDEKAIEAANKMQLSGNPLWLEIKRFAYDYEKQIVKLKAQIDKMRNFQNCDYQLHIIDCPIFKSGGHISCKKMSLLDFTGDKRK